MDLPRRLFGGVDRKAAERAVEEQRRSAEDLSTRLASLEAQLAEVRADRDAAREQLADLQAQIADVLRLATRAAAETEAETAERVTEATEQAQKRVDDLAVEAADAAERAAALAEALQDAVRTYKAMLPIEVSGGAALLDPPGAARRADSEAEGPFPFGGALDDATTGEAEPEEPLVLDREPPPVVIEEAEEPTPPPAEQPPEYTTVVARPLPSPAAAVEVEQRLNALRGVREVTLRKLGSAEAEFVVSHEPGGLDLTPLTRLGVPVSVQP